MGYVLILLILHVLIVDKGGGELPNNPITIDTQRRQHALAGSLREHVMRWFTGGRGGAGDPS